MVIGRRSLLLAGVAVPVAARGQCVTDTPSVDACYGGVRITQPPGVTLDLSFFGLPLDPRITFTRASTATYFDSSGTMQTTAYNFLRNNTSQGAVAGTPGTLPTNWSINLNVSGLSSQVVGTGIENGIPFIDIRLFGTASPSQITLIMEPVPSGIAAASGQVWCMSVYQRLVAGAITNIGSPILSVRELTVAGATVRDDNLAVANPTNASLDSQRVNSGAITLSGGGTVTNICPRYVLTSGTGPADATFRIGAPQMELGASPSAFVPTYGAANGAPRFDYDPVTHALRGLLVEEARTNLLLNSLTAGWGANNVVATAFAGIAPDGTNNMVRVAETATTTFHLDIAPLVTVVAATVYTFSICAQAQQNRYLQLIYDDNTSNGVNANFDLQTGTISLAAAIGGSATNGSANIQAIGNGIYRCSVTCATNGGTSGRFAIGLINTATAAKFASYLGNVANGLLVWGAQAEAGAFSTSYIPTTGAAVTRAQDVCAISPANMSPWFASPGGSWMAEFVNFNPAPVNARAIGRPDIPGGPSPVFLNPALNGAQYDGVAAMATANSTSANFVVKISSTWAAGQATVCTNGGAVATSATLTTGYGLLATNGVKLFQVVSPATADCMTGYIRRVRYWPRVLSNAELQQVTR